jgi:hypothetical protein
MTSPHRGDDRGGAAGLESADAHEIGVVEIVARVVVHQIAHHQQPQRRQARGRTGPHARDLGQRGLGGESGVVAVGGPGDRIAALHQPKHRWRHRRGRWLETLTQQVQPLTALANQVLAAADAQAPVRRKAITQELQLLAFRLRQRRWWLSQAGGHEGAEALLAAHQIAEALAGLQLQRLLQGAQPAV